MRKCPHCNNEVQDEAVFCRFCRRDIEPPLWLTSLQKCPYCAEWVERGIEACPLCGKFLVDESEISEPTKAEEDSPVSRLRNLDPLQRLRQNLIEEDEAPEEQVVPDPVERDLSTFSESDSQPGSMFDEFEEPKPRRSLLSRRVTPPPSMEFRSSRIEKEPEEEPGDLWAAEPKAAPSRPSREFKIVTSSSLRRIGVGLAAIGIPVILIFLALGPGKPAITDLFDQVGGALTANTPTPTTDPSIDETPLVAATLPPLDSTNDSQNACLSWDEVTEEDQGQERCVEGIVRRWFSVPDMPFVAIFTEEVGTFAIVDRQGPHPEVRPGDCIRARGVVEVMRGPRPFIDIDGVVEFCETD